LVFAGVLATGAATGAWGGDVRALPDLSGSAKRQLPADAYDEGRPGAGGAYGASAHAGAHGARSGGEQGQDAQELVSRSGDRWSSALSAHEYEGFRRSLSGEYTGVGISVRRDKSGANASGSESDGSGPAPHTSNSAASPTTSGSSTPPAPSTPSASSGPAGASDGLDIARVRPGSPAAHAGVRPGDRLHRIDGRDVDGRPVTDVVAALRGSAGAAGHSGNAAKPGSPITLTLSRGGHRWEQTLHRAHLRTDAVTVDRMAHGVTSIKVTSFTKGSGEQVRRAVARHAPHSSGLLLDLRGNSGGLVTEAVTAASAFLHGGLVATYREHGAQHALYAEHGSPARGPLVVLVDSGTMSAAELLTGALQDRGRAVVVGSRTFGKGTVQIPRRQPDGSVAELTVGQYATPSGRRLDGEGITPDLAVSASAHSPERARTVLSGLEPRA